MLVSVRGSAHPIVFVSFIVLIAMPAVGVAGDCSEEGAVPTAGEIVVQLPPVAGEILVVAEGAQRVEVVGGPSQSVRVVAPTGSAIAVGGAGRPGIAGASGN